jgi:hypothetical protein
MFGGGLICAIAIAIVFGPIPAQADDPAPTATSVGVRVTSDNLHIGGAVLPAQPGGPVTLTVLRSKGQGAPYKRVRTTDATINLEGSYATTIRRKRKGACQLIAEWPGDADSLPSSASTGFRC